MSIRTTILVLVLLSMGKSLFSQQTMFDSRVNFNLGTIAFYPEVNEPGSETTALWYADVSYNFNRHWDLGIYAGYGMLMQGFSEKQKAEHLAQLLEMDSTYDISKVRISDAYSMSAKRYGFTAKVHIMSFLYEKDSRFDFYLQPQLGFLKQEFYSDEDLSIIKWSKPYIEYGIGMGVRYRFTKIFGIFGDYNYGNFYNNSKRLVKCGIALTL